MDDKEIEIQREKERKEKEERMYEDIRERIRDVFNDKGTNPNRISEEIDIPQETLNRQINQTTKINVQTLTSIYLRYPDISLPWLLCGVGEKYTTPPLQLTPPDNVSEENWKYISKYAAESSLCEIPLLYFPEIMDPYLKDENQVTTIQLPHAKEGDIALVVTGKSMEPDYPGGACIHLRKISKWHKALKYGFPCLLELTDKRRVLTVLQPAENPLLVRLIFTNESYPVAEIPVSMVKSVWEVLAKYQKVVF